MKKLFWIGTGVALTVFVMAKGKKFISQYTPTALTERVGEQAADLGARAGDAAGGFLADFRAAAQSREQELRDSLLAETQGSLEDLESRRTAYRQGPQAARAQDFLDDDSEDEELGYSF